MRLEIVLRYLGITALLNAAFMLLSALVSVIYADGTALPLLYAALVCAGLGAFPLVFVPPSEDISRKEGLLVVVLSWITSCAVGAVPYLLSSSDISFANAWFESVSGFTTTGATIFPSVESLPHGLLFWRAATHWLGGIGIVLFALALMPFVGLAEMVLVRSEVSDLAQETLRHRARRVVQILSGIYFGLTLLQTLALLACGMSPFDAITHSFATIATGGFSTHDASIAHFQSLRVEMVTLLFMILSGMNFALLYALIRGRPAALYRSSVTRLYLGSLAVGTLLCSLSLAHSRGLAFPSALRVASFQVTSVSTSTGFATADSSMWPALCQLLLILLTLQCACAGSTSGGIKVDRIFLAIKSFVRQIAILQHPKALLPVRFDGRRLDELTVSMALLYIAVYLVVCVVATLLLTAMGVDLLSAFSGSVACMGNVGPGLGSVGSTGNFSQIPAAGRLVLTAVMLLGRVEIYALVLLLLPSQWNRRIAY